MTTNVATPKVVPIAFPWFPLPVQMTVPPWFPLVRRQWKFSTYIRTNTDSRRTYLNVATDYSSIISLLVISAEIDLSIDNDLLHRSPKRLRR